jgi:hypothetical protein
VPIDVKEVAAELDADPDIVFGRLYYHLDAKHRYRQDDNSLVNLFTLKAGEDRHCINFPYLAALVANLQDENRKYRTATRIAIWSLVVSIVALLISIFMPLVRSSNS